MAAATTKCMGNGPLHLKLTGSETPHPKDMMVLVHTQKNVFSESEIPSKEYSIVTFRITFQKTQTCLHPCPSHNYSLVRKYKSCAEKIWLKYLFFRNVPSLSGHLCTVNLCKMQRSVVFVELVWIYISVVLKYKSVWKITLKVFKFF